MLLVFHPIFHPPATLSSIPSFTHLSSTFHLLNNQLSSICHPFFTNPPPTFHPLVTRLPLASQPCSISPLTHLLLMYSPYTHLSPTFHPPAASISIGPRRVSRSRGATPSCLSSVGDLRHCGVLTISCPSQCSTSPASFRVRMLPQNNSCLLQGVVKVITLTYRTVCI